MIVSSPAAPNIVSLAVPERSTSPNAEPITRSTLVSKSPSASPPELAKRIDDAAPRLFTLLLSLKKRDEALAFETQWQAAHPQDATFAGAVADVLLSRGEFELALTRYEALLKRSPDALPVLNNV
eukprot:gene20066-biopygen16892